MCNVIFDRMYKYVLPRIFKTDNRKEFNNKAREEVVDEMKICKVCRRPYYSQSQGREERFYQTLTNFLRHDLQTEKD